MQALAVGRQLPGRAVQRTCSRRSRCSSETPSTPQPNLPNGPLAIGYGSDTSRGSRGSRGSRRRSPDFYNLSSSDGGEADSEGQSSAEEQPSSMQLALRSLQLNREPSLRAVAGNFLKGAALPIVLPTAAAHTAFQALMRQFEGARSEGLSIQYAPRRRLRGKQRVDSAAVEDAPQLAIEDAPRRRLRGKQPRPAGF
jgi:hypothetical protein